MPITDKIAAAKRISELLNGIITTGDFHLRYKIMVDPPAGEHDFDKPVIKVELSGADSPLVLERGGELLRAFEHVALEMLRLGPDEHDKVIFDCQNFRSARLRSCAWPPTSRPTACARAACPTPSPPCRRANAACCTSLCAIWKTCAPKAPAKRCNATSWSIPRTTRVSRPHRRHRATEITLHPRSSS